MDSEALLLGRMLGIAAPWEVRRCGVDTTRQRVEVWIGLEAPRSWFGLGKRDNRATVDQTWRHLPVCGMQTILHVALPVGSQPARVDWQGDAGLPFSHLLARRLAEHFSEGLTPVQICRLCGVEMDDLWKYKFALDRGRTGAGLGAAATPAEPVPQTAAPAAAPAEDAATPDIVPETDPIWAQLADGSIDIDIRALGLKLLLTRVRNQVKSISDREVLALKRRELHRFFIKNARTLGHELDQLRALAAPRG